MAEFRKREDITHEIDLLQQWSDLGAPRIQDLDQSLRHVLRTVDPLTGGKVEIRTLPASPAPRAASPHAIPTGPGAHNAPGRPSSLSPTPCGR